MWEFITALSFEFVIIVLALIIGFFLGSSKDQQPAVTDIVTEAEILVVLRTLSTPLEPEVALEAVRRIRDKGALFREVVQE